MQKRPVTPTACLSTAGSLDRLWTVTVDTGAPADRAAHCFADWRTLRELLADRYDQTLAAVGIAAGNADSRTPNSSYRTFWGGVEAQKDMAESGLAEVRGIDYAGGGVCATC